MGGHVLGFEELNYLLPGAGALYGLIVHITTAIRVVKELTSFKMIGIMFELLNILIRFFSEIIEDLSDFGRVFQLLRELLGLFGVEFY
jgi:hypothetical protein